MKLMHTERLHLQEALFLDSLNRKNNPASPKVSDLEIHIPVEISERFLDAPKQIVTLVDTSITHILK